MAPPMTESTCTYLSLFGLGIEPSRLLGRPGGEPSGRDIAEVFAGTLLTLRQRFPSTLLTSQQCATVLAPPQSVDRPRP
jgi:hypothetical protein